MSRVIAITGASAGIGRATAPRVARDGAVLAICARRADRLDAVAAEITAAGGQALPIVANVTHADDMDGLVARSVETTLVARRLRAEGASASLAEARADRPRA